MRASSLYVDGTFDSGKWGDVFRTIVAPINAHSKLTGRPVRIQVHVMAEHMGTEGGTFLRQLREAARQLGLEVRA